MAMDTLLEQGDHGVDARGIPISVEGAEELMQRAMIRLGVRKGSYFADPALGSELHRLPAADTEATRRMAQSYVQEALLPLPELRVQSVTCKRTAEDALTVAVALRYEESNWLLEVTV